MTQLQEEDPGAAPKLVCSDCNAPWGTFPKCLLCKGSSPIDLSSTPLSVIAVEGQNWQLRLTEAGPAGVLADAKVTKDSGFVEVGDLGRPHWQQSLALAGAIGFWVPQDKLPIEREESLMQVRLACLWACRRVYMPYSTRTVSSNWHVCWCAAMLTVYDDMLQIVCAGRLDRHVCSLAEFGLACVQYCCHVLTACF